MLSLFFPLWVGAQSRYSADYFIQPLDDIRSISGTFGELRPAHFHSGLDIKTPTGVGQPVYAAADGYVSRIKISSVGYGNAVYITHPNGYVSQYGHLLEFTGDIALLCRKMQYREKSFEIDVSFSPSECKVKKGQRIALSGNSGSSSGPHLHFEVRDEKTENIINPLLFGLQVPDKTPPVIRSLRITPWREWCRVNGSSRAEVLKVKGEAGRYSLRSEIEIAGPAVLALETYDKQEASPGKNGPYEICLTAGKDTLFFFRAETFHFRDTRYANAFLNYDAWRESGREYFQCYLAPGNRYPYVRRGKTDGLLVLKPGESMSCTLQVADYAGNISILPLQVRGVAPSAEVKPESSCAAIWTPFKPNRFANKEFQIEVPEGALYDTTCFQYSMSKKIGKYSYEHSLTYPLVPLHVAAEVSILQQNISRENRKKTVLIIENGDDKSVYTGSWQADWFKARTREFGTFYLDIDEVSPEILPLNVSDGKTFLPGDKLLFLVQDKLSGIQKWELKVDNRWELAAFDAKTGKITAVLPEFLGSGKHTLELWVEDKTENSKTVQFSILIP